MKENPVFLFEWEVAERLRCKVSKIKRLRLTGQLAYIPGRPLLISEEDLAAYLESVRKAADSQKPQKPELTHAQRVADARKWALQAKLFRRSTKT